MAVGSDVAVNMGVQVPSRYHSFGQIPGSGVAGWQGSCIFNFLRNLRAVLLSGCASLHSHRQCTRVPVLCSLAGPCSPALLTLAILMGVRGYLIVGLTFISLKLSDASIFSWVCWPSACLFLKKVIIIIFLIFGRILPHDHPGLGFSVKCTFNYEFSFFHGYGDV